MMATRLRTSVICPPTAISRASCIGTRRTSMTSPSTGAGCAGHEVRCQEPHRVLVGDRVGEVGVARSCASSRPRTRSPPSAPAGGLAEAPRPPGIRPPVSPRSTAPAGIGTGQPGRYGRPRPPARRRRRSCSGPPRRYRAPRPDAAPGLRGRRSRGSRRPGARRPSSTGSRRRPASRRASTAPR